MSGDLLCWHYFKIAALKSSFPVILHVIVAKPAQDQIEAVLQFTSIRSITAAVHSAAEQISTLEDHSVSDSIDSAAGSGTLSVQIQLYV